MALRIILIAVALAALLIGPQFLGPSKINVVTHALAMALFALGYGLLAGQAGMLAFGHAAYFGAGAFTAIHTMQAVEAGVFYIPMPLVPVVAAAVGFLFGIGAGYFATIRTGIYFSMITLALAELVFSLAPVLPEIFGGEGGLSGLRYPWLGINFYTEIENYYLVLVWVLLCTALLYAYTLTPLGRLTVALRDNEKRVSFLGFNARRTRNLVFAISSAFAAIAGSLWAITLEHANYTILGLETSANVVLATFIGGATTFFGPAVGAVLLVALQSIVSDYSKLWLLYQGLLFIALMLYAPKGILPLLGKALEQFASGDRAGSARAAGKLSLGVVGAVALVAFLEYVGREFESGQVDPIVWVVAAVLFVAITYKAVRVLFAQRSTAAGATSK